MFDSVLSHRAKRQSRWGSGLVIALAIHAAAVAAAVWVSSHAPAPRQVEEVPLTFFQAPPPPPPPPKGSPTPKTVQAHRQPTRRPQTFVLPKEAPIEKPPEPKPEEEGKEEGEAGGVEGGVIGGVVGGVPGGVVGQGTGPVEFNESMTRPTKVSGPDPAYTPQAVDHEVEGLMLVKCIVTAQGVVQQCRVVKSLPFMDQAVLQALEHRRYTPALLHGRPIDVDYTFKIKLKLPR